MHSEHMIRVMAGVVVLLGVALGFFVNEWCLLIPVLAASNLVQSAFTGICPPIMLLRHLRWLDAKGNVVWGGGVSQESAGATTSDKTDVVKQVQMQSNTKANEDNIPKSNIIGAQIA